MSTLDFEQNVKQADFIMQNVQASWQEGWIKKADIYLKRQKKYAKF